MNIIVRRMQAADIPEVLAIENSWSFLSKWGNEGYSKVLRDPRIYVCLVAEDHYQEGSQDKSSLAGLAVLALLIDYCELCNLVVRPDYLSKKVGYRLLRSCLDISRQKKVSRMFLEVRTSNTRAIEFYKANGFQIVSKRKNYYRDPPEDALIMERKDLDESLSPPNQDPPDRTGQSL